MAARRLKQFARRFLPRDIRTLLETRSLKVALQYYFFQRILRINSHVPWPVHWTSGVMWPDRIKCKSSHRPIPGSNYCQYIQAWNGIEFGENVWLGPGVNIISADHDLSDYSAHLRCEPIRVGDFCWIGANAVILPGVTLGDHVVVAAGAVVTRSFPSDCVIGGVPAKVIKQLGPYRGKGAVVNAGSGEMMGQ